MWVRGCLFWMPIKYKVKVRLLHNIWHLSTDGWLLTGAVFLLNFKFVKIKNWQNDPPSYKLYKSLYTISTLWILFIINSSNKNKFDIGTRYHPNTHKRKITFGYLYLLRRHFTKLAQYFLKYNYVLYPNPILLVSYVYNLPVSPPYVTNTSKVNASKPPGIVQRKTGQENFGESFSQLHISTDLSCSSRCMQKVILKNCMEINSDRMRNCTL